MVACSTNDFDAEEVIRFDHGGRSFANFRTHENVYLCDGMVLENTVECPKHASIFDFTAGEVKPPPACNDLRTYPARIEGGRVMVDI